MSGMDRIAVSDFAKHFSNLTELSSIALGGRIVSVSDEFFAAAYHLLLVEPAPSMKGQFGPNGALYNGWETRRHNPTYDWCIIQLGTSGVIHGFDVDTANFNGNEAPAVSIYGLYDSGSEDPQHSDTRWAEILPKSNLGPNSRHIFKTRHFQSCNYLKLHMYPDGGIARLRAYGKVIPIHPSRQTKFDLAHAFAGGRVLRVSDQHFGVGSNLILPGRGINMGDGWETKRSRTKDHCDWVIIQLGAIGQLSEVEIDTNHFLGNFPESCEIHATLVQEDLDWNSYIPEDKEWTLILPRTKLGPHRQHYFELENVENRTCSHVKITIYPDGGLKRVRIIGRKDEGTPPLSRNDGIHVVRQNPSSHEANIVMVPVISLTSESFSPFGQVIQAYDDPCPKGIKVTPANDGTAKKFHKLSLLSSSYPSEAGDTTGISLYKCQPLKEISDGMTVLTRLERHLFTTQAFIPMGSDNGECADHSHRYLVVVACNGLDDRPDFLSLRAFVATATQGISYNAGIWHQPMTVLGKSLDLACVETQIGDGSVSDCEIIDLEHLDSTYMLKLEV